MKSIFEILKVILPAIITGIFTFFITKYTYNKNRPLDKLEIAYNRVYYPIYRLIATNNNNIDRQMEVGDVKTITSNGGNTVKFVELLFSSPSNFVFKALISASFLPISSWILVANNTAFAFPNFSTVSKGLTASASGSLATSTENVICRFSSII